MHARRPSRLCDHGLGTALVRGGYHRYRLLPASPPHEHVPPGKPPFNILNCRGARCVAGAGVDVLRGDVRRVLFAGIPQELHRAG